MLQIAAHLRSTGHEVWLLTGGAYREAVQGVGVEFAVLPSDGCVDQALAESLSLQLLPSLLRRAGSTWQKSLSFPRGMLVGLVTWRSMVTRCPIMILIGPPVYAVRILAT